MWTMLTFKRVSTSWMLAGRVDSMLKICAELSDVNISFSFKLIIPIDTWNKTFKCK